MLFPVLLGLLTSCVGTVEDNSLETTKAYQADSESIDYIGLESANPIASDKVELYFYPTTIDAATITYQITYDGLQVPITVPGLNLSPNYKGLLRYVVEGLKTNTTYNFSVEIFSDDGAKSQSGIIVAATTFDNYTADFKGIGKVSNLSGADGLNSLLVEWALVPKKGTDASPVETDVVEYIVTIIDADYLTPADMNNTSYSSPQRREVLVAKTKRSVIVNGLKSDTKYFIQVRAKHQGMITYANDDSYISEENTKYLEISTLSNDLASYDFDQASLVLSLPFGSAGLSSVNLNWDAGQGAFDSYRIYFKKASDAGDLTTHISDVLCDGQEGATNIYCKSVSYDTTSTTIADFDSNTEYDFMVVLCQTSSCGVGEKIQSDIKKITTTPETALFGGVVDILPARDVNYLDYVYLQVNPPNLTNGILHGLLVEYTDSNTSSTYILNHPYSSNVTSLSVIDFNYETVDEITISGLEVGSGKEYCFTVFPFTYDGVGGIVEHRGSESAKCITPTIKAPTDLEFSGLVSCNVGVTGEVTVQWKEPTAGIYQYFDVFYTTSFFNFSSALAGYDSVRVSGSKLTTVLPMMPSGTYQIGVLTYINILGNDIRSDFNSNILTCTVP